jgi:hypothetical protein
MLVSEPSISSTRGTLDILTPRMCEALDRCKISDRNAVHLAAAEAFYRNIERLTINRSSIRLRRKEMREKRQAQIKGRLDVADSNALVLHWDSKLVPAASSIEKIDRLAIFITFNGKE